MKVDLTKILNKQQRKTILTWILTPFSWAYGAGVWVRNFMFNNNIIFKSRNYDDRVAVVSVGNITVGGTGKTPHVEYIIEHLCRTYRTAVLSRGYKRRTTGFILATDAMGPRDIGDEPYQIYRKFNGLITLAVCESRRKGIETLLDLRPDLQLILLDDGFQHRFVKPKVNIVLMDYTRPPYEDQLLPLGTLREPMHRLLDSDMVVVTKCPADLSPVTVSMIKRNLDLFPSTELFFSQVLYGEPRPVFPITQPQLPSLRWLTPDDLVVCVTGVANPKPFALYLRTFPALVRVIHFDDHHEFTRRDFDFIFNEIDKYKDKKRRFIVTTEKDAVRILNNPYYPPKMQDMIYFVPIKVAFVDHEAGARDFVTELTHKIDEPSGSINLTT
ncbi:MAG: tetraacyldisaccharide 4'-kinase [Muribaculaceae bacterium]|nr:tetraacyldisaccharide 4'-kinase [Muribaculaceae bacterium]